ncbi:hypothetical protein WA158_007916 [Blastocystis sp. Blastoise]
MAFAFSIGQFLTDLSTYLPLLLALEIILIIPYHDYLFLQLFFDYPMAFVLRVTFPSLFLFFKSIMSTIYKIIFAFYTSLLELCLSPLNVDGVIVNCTDNYNIVMDAIKDDFKISVKVDDIPSSSISSPISSSTSTSSKLKLRGTISGISRGNESDISSEWDFLDKDNVPKIPLFLDETDINSKSRRRQMNVRRTISGIDSEFSKH